MPRVWGRIGYGGGRLELLEYGVSVQIPEGAVGSGPEDPSSPEIAEFFLGICSDQPRLNDRQTLLAPVILVCTCNSGFVLRKPIVITCQHCADLSTPSDWRFSVYTNESRLSSAHPDPGNSAHPDSDWWDVSVTVGRETLNSTIFCQIETDRCHILTESLGRLALVGEVVPDSVESGLKRIRLLTFVSDVSLRVYCLADTRTNVQWALQQEDDLGGRLAADPEQCLSIECGRDLCLYLEDIRPQWRLKQGANYQEIPAVHLWNPTTPALHCSFALESPAMVKRHPTDYLSGRLTIYQKGQQSQRLVIDVDTSVDWPWSHAERDKESVQL